MSGTGALETLIARRDKRIMAGRILLEDSPKNMICWGECL